MTTTSDTVIVASAPRTTGLVAPIWLVLFLLVGLLSLGHDAVRTWERATGFPGRGGLGVAFGDYCQADGFCTVRDVKPGGPMAAAGVREGDGVRFDRPYDFFRTLRAGETFGFTLRNADGRVHRQATAVPAPPPGEDPVARHLTYAMWVTAGLVGLLVMLRSGRRPTPFLLSAGLACLSLSGTNPSLLESDPRWFVAFVWTSQLIFTACPILFLAFARSARLEIDDRPRRTWTALLAAFGAVHMGLALYQVWTQLNARVLAGVGDTFALSVAVTDLGYLLALIALADAWRISRGEARTRYAFLLLATFLLTSSMNGLGLAINLTGNDWTLGNPLVVAMVGGSLAGTLVLAYAVLRHRVLDLGFAVNRTLVYGVLSAGLLVAFGLIEWAVEHFLPLNSHETGVVLDAVVALALFLTFHRVRDFIEHAIEGVFFRSWRRKEAELNRFLREAGFVTRPEALIEVTVAALRRFSDGGEVAVYRAEANGYALAGGGLRGLSARLHPDLPALVRLRAERQPLDDDDSTALHAALVLPMVHRTELTGLILLGPKPSGDGFRPDERDLLAGAAHQIGMDLHALNIDALEDEASVLRRDLAIVTGKFETLSLALRTT